MQQHRLADKVALITGAAQGLGAATARMFAAHGARLAVTDINESGVAAVADAINAEYGDDTAIAFHHDVTDEARWQAVLDETVTRFGGLHVLVNNAGIGFMKTVEDTSLDEWRHLHAVDLDSVFLGCKHAIAHIERSGGGSIVNISSISGVIADRNLAAYNSAKAAVGHLSRSVALHCARKANPIRCNSVHPVYIVTPILDGLIGNRDRESVFAKFAKQVPMGRLGEPDDVAYAVLFLASDESKFITGSELRVDGGISAM
ncbi:MAG: SDR family oxidoreductase [Sphingomonadales bacterium]